MAGAIATALGVTLPIRHPAFTLTYAGQNITTDITAMVIELTYSDTSGAYTRGRGRHHHKEADEIEVTLEDRDRRWQGSWYPQQGDTVSLQMGYETEPYLNCGTFQVDELELTGPPDTFHIKCISAAITPSLRTKRSFAYENVTLLDVANVVAARNGLTVVNAQQTQNISWQRITQHHETDLAFLRRLALAHNYDFTVRNNQLVFYDRTTLEQSAPVLTVLRTQTKAFEFRDKTQAVYEQAQVAYQNPQQKALLTALSSTPSGDIFLNPQDVAANEAFPGTSLDVFTLKSVGDNLFIPMRVENQQQAKLKADSALHDANMLQITGRLELEGTTLLVAGVNITISGFKNFDGNYHITASTHRLDRSTGYSTEIEVRQL